MVLIIGLAVLATSCYRSYDFDNDNKADVVWMQPDGTWFRDAAPAPSVLSTGTAPGAGNFVVAAAGDYDGKGTWQAAEVVGTPDNSYQPTWITHGSAGTITYAPPTGPAGFETNNRYAIVPVPAAYDGGNRTVPAWYRDFDGMWFIQGHDPIQFGTGPTSTAPDSAPGHANLDQDQDVPVPADYDGDGKADLAVYAPTTGVWRILSSSTGTVTTTTLGGAGRLPVPADYDGVKHAQIAVFNLAAQPRGSYVIEGHAPTIPDGGTDELPLPADYDGDGRAELATIDNTGHVTPAPSVWRIPATPSTPGRSVTIPGTAWIQPAEVPAWLQIDLARLTLIAHNACGTASSPGC